jgi:hypothetical protein
VKKVLGGCLTLLVTPVIVTLILKVFVDPGYGWVPSVTKMYENEAIMKLKSKGFEYSEKRTHGGQRDWVFSQAPSPGSFYRKDKPVDLFVQDGLIPVPLPDTRIGTLESNRTDDVPANGDVIVPAGTVFSIALNEPLVISQSSSSQTLEATVAKPVFINGQVLCYDRAAAQVRYEAKATATTVEAEMGLIDVVLVNGATLAVQSDELKKKASASIGAVTGGALGGGAAGAILGTIVGSIFGFPELGMLGGTVVGAPIGALAATELTKKLTINAGTIVQFTLQDEQLVHFAAR